MTQHDDLVIVASGALAEIQAWGEILLSEGIHYHVVTGNLTGLDTSLPNPVELWVHRADVEAAETAMADRFYNSLDDTQLD